MTPRKDGGINQTPTVNNLSKQKVVESKVAVEGGVDETKTHVSSATDTDEFMSAQGSTTSESEPITLETQDSTSNVTDVYELSEGVGTTTGFTTPKRFRQSCKYFAVAIGRKSGVYTDPDDYDK